MVVDYLPVNQKVPLTFYAAFVASPTTAQYFRMGEPPAHDKWEDDPRIDETEDPATGHHILKAFKSEINQRLRIWLRAFKPKPPEVSDKIPLLDEVLGKFLKVKKTGPPPVPGGNVVSPVVFSTTKSDFIQYGKKQIKLECRLNLNPETELSELEIIAKPTCRALLDSRLSRDKDEIGLNMFECKPQDNCRNTTEGVWAITIRKGEEVRVVIESNPFDPRVFVEIALNLENKP